MEVKLFLKYNQLHINLHKFLLIYSLSYLSIHLFFTKTLYHAIKNNKSIKDAKLKNVIKPASINFEFFWLILTVSLFQNSTSCTVLKMECSRAIWRIMNFLKRMILCTIIGIFIILSLVQFWLILLLNRRRQIETTFHNQLLASLRCI